MDSNQHMKHALSLALGGLGTVSPNPLVGCVVVKNGIVIGKGFHKKHSAIHAEVAALDSCTVSPKTGHLFCNLEPCGRMYTGKKHINLMLGLYNTYLSYFSYISINYLP